MPATLVQDIKDILTILTPIALAIIAYKQVRMSIKQSIIHKQIDGMKSELVEAVRGRSNAEGQLTGMEKEKQSAIDAAKVIVVPGVQEVKIVEQDKPIDVKVQPEDKK